MGVRVLILGGAGFIGSHLAEAYAALGWAVDIVDNLASGRRDNLAGISGMVRLIYKDAATSGWYVPNKRYDVIVQAAGLAATRLFTSRPVEAFWASVWPLEAALRYKRYRHRAVRVIYLSSSEIYGDPDCDIQHESYVGRVNCRGPRSGYDEGKRAGEALVESYQREYGVGCTVLRLFNTFGPRMASDGPVVPTMIRDALTQRLITVNEPGTQTRTLVYVIDTVRAILAAADLAEDPPYSINIGGTETFTVQEIAELVREVMGDPGIRIQRGPAVPEEPLRRRPDIRRAQSVLHWQPQVSVREGIVRTAQWISQQLQEGRL